MTKLSLRIDIAVSDCGLILFQHSFGIVTPRPPVLPRLTVKGEKFVNVWVVIIHLRILSLQNFPAPRPVESRW